MAKIKPGTPHPNRGGMVMGMNNRYVSKGTYAKQKQASKTAASKKVTPQTSTKSSTPKSLPSAGNTSATKDTPRNFPRGRASARRAEAAARQARAAQGTKGGNRTGQPAGSANRKYGANRVAAATSRAQRSSAARGIGRGARGLVGGRGGALAIANALKPVTDRIAKEAVRGAKVVSGQPNSGKRNIKNVGGTSYDISTPAGRRGYNKAIRNKYPTTANTKTVKKSRDYQAEAKSKATSTPTTKSSPTPKPKTDNRSTLTKEIDGLTKFLATHKGKKGMERALTQARKSLAAKKKKRSQRSTTMSGTLPSNRNSA